MISLVFVMRQGKNVYCSHTHFCLVALLLLTRRLDHAGIEARSDTYYATRYIIHKMKCAREKRYFSMEYSSPCFPLLKLDKQKERDCTCLSLDGWNHYCEFSEDLLLLKKTMIPGYNYCGLAV